MSEGREEKGMKILITSDLFEATINGVVTSVKNLERELISGLLG